MAAADFHLFTKIFSTVDTSLATYVDGVAGSVIGGILTAANKMAVIYIVLWGYSMMRGMIREPLKDGLFRILRLSLILGLMDLTRYDAYVSDFFMTAPDAMATVIAGGASGDTTISFLDSLWSQIYTFGETFWQAGISEGLSGIGQLLMGIAVWGMGLVACVAGAGMILLAKIGIHVWLGIGPLFILLMMFEPTKHLGNSWLGQLISFAVMTILASAIIKLILTVCQTYLSTLGTGGVVDTTVDQIAPVVVLCGLAFMYFKQIPSFAAGLGGGVAVSTLGIVGAGWQAAKGGLGGVKNLVTGKTLSDMRGERKQKFTNANWAKNHPGLTARAAAIPMAAFRKATGPRQNSIAKL